MFNFQKWSWCKETLPEEQGCCGLPEGLQEHSSILTVHLTEAFSPRELQELVVQQGSKDLPNHSSERKVTVALPVNPPQYNVTCSQKAQYKSLGNSPRKTWQEQSFSPPRYTCAGISTKNSPGHALLQTLRWEPADWKTAQRYQCWQLQWELCLVAKMMQVGEVPGTAGPHLHPWSNSTKGKLAHRELPAGGSFDTDRVSLHCKTVTCWPRQHSLWGSTTQNISTGTHCREVRECLPCSLSLPCSTVPAFPP